MIRVLVVDDDPNVRFTVRVALEGSPPPAGEPMDVTEAADGRAALDVVARNELRGLSFDVVLLELDLPEVAGHEVLRALRQSGDDPAVVVLTSRTREVEIVNAYRAGADGYVTKPFDVDHLAELTRAIAMSDAVARAARRRRELDRAELLMQLEHGFGFGLGPPVPPTRG